MQIQLQRIRRWVIRLHAAAIGLALFSAGSLHAQPGGEIKDPHYGDVLFQYFQDRYFSAATTLMVSQQFDRVSHHREEAEVLRGGILLSYGLHREAGDIFARLIAMGATPAARDRAWYFLAKIRYQRGYIAEAQEAMAQIGTALAPELQEDRTLLQANLQMARSDYTGAANTLSTVDSKTPSARYLRFNLGVALIKSGQKDSGTSVLDTLGRAPAEDEEYRGLRDRANLALGFAAMADNDPKTARSFLERVRLKSQQANKALLGLGWAAAAMKEPQLALVPWMELTERDVQDSAVLEAHIAVPYAYAELGAYTQSAKAYETAVGIFTRENAALVESIQAINTGKLVQALVDRNPGEEMGWFWSVRELPDMPHASHLAHVLAQHDFQEALKNYRDLVFLSRNLQEWREKLVVFDDMLANRRRAFAERLPQVLARSSAAGIDPLRQRHTTAGDMVAAGVNAADGLAFADAKQVALLARIAKVHTTLKAADDAADTAAAFERIRLASGALTWQLAQDYPTRAWQARQLLDTINNELATAQRLEAALAQAQQDEPARFDRFGKRIAAITPVLDAMVPRLAALTHTQQQSVQAIAIAELTRQQDRLGVYATQARYALAQLYDRGTERAADRADPSKDAGHAKQP